MTPGIWNVADYLYWSASVGFIVDVVLLCLALLALGRNRDVVSPDMVTVLAVADFLLLLLQTSLGRLTEDALAKQAESRA